MRRYLIGALLICALLPSGPNRSPAQDLLRAAAVVNDAVISMFDLDMRLRLAILSTGQPDNEQLRQRMQPQVMRGLIDEQLRRQEAERLGITVAPEKVEEVAREVIQRNNMTRQSFERLLQSRGIHPSAFLDQIQAQLIWNTLIARRLRPSVEVTEEEVEEVAQRIAANRGSKQRLVAEIFLGVDSVLQEDEVHANARRLFEQLRQGANFPSLARQFSESASAARGGSLGWIPEGQLAPELDQLLARMQPGELAPPVRTPSGFHILLLRDEREMTAGEITLNLKQVLFALPQQPSEEQERAALERAEAARGQVVGCDSLDELAARIGSPGSGDLGSLELSNLPPRVREAVAELPIGQPSEPVPVSGGISVLVVCDRAESGIDRERIRERLIAERLDIKARRYMRDLRRSANVDIRL